MTPLFGTVRALLLCALFAGCTSPPVLPVGEERRPWKSYALGAEIYSRTGAPMLTQRDGFTRPTFMAIHQIPSPLVIAVPREVEWVARYRYISTGCGNAEYVVTNPHWYRGSIGFLVDRDGVIPCEFGALEVARPRFLRRSGRTWSVGGLAGQKVFEQVYGSPTSYQSLTQKELIYSGRADDVIFVLYREYVDDLARPAFFQELRYDLRASSRVVFLDWEIQVFEASNEGIRFAVVRD